MHACIYTYIHTHTHTNMQGLSAEGKGQALLKVAESGDGAAVGQLVLANADVNVRNEVSACLDRI